MYLFICLSIYLSIAFYSVQFCSVLFYSILFYSILIDLIYLIYLASNVFSYNIYIYIYTSTHTHTQRALSMCCKCQPLVSKRDPKSRSWQWCSGRVAFCGARSLNMSNHDTRLIARARVPGSDLLAATAHFPSFRQSVIDLPLWTHVITNTGGTTPSSHALSDQNEHLKRISRWAPKPSGCTFSSPRILSSKHLWFSFFKARTTMAFVTQDNFLFYIPYHPFPVEPEIRGPLKRNRSLVADSPPSRADLARRERFSPPRGTRRSRWPSRRRTKRFWAKVASGSLGFPFPRAVEGFQRVIFLQIHQPHTELTGFPPFPCLQYLGHPPCPLQVDTKRTIPPF